MLDAQRLHRPHGQVTVAPAVVAAPDFFRELVGVQRVALVGRAVEHAERRRVGVERPLLRFHQAAVQGHLALFAAERAPLRIGRVVVLVVIDIHGKRQRMLV